MHAYFILLSQGLTHNTFILQYVDYDRKRLSKFMNHDGPASAMVKGMGEAIEIAYNLKGELVGPRNPDGPTTSGAHFSNTDAAGNYVVG